jgi:hypothetical protein
LIVNPGPATGFNVTLSSSQVNVGSGVTVSVRAVDQYGNTATGFTGTVTISSSNVNALPSGTVYLAGGQGSTTLTAQHSDVWLGISGVTLTASGTNAAGARLSYNFGTITVNPSGYLYTYTGSASFDDSEGARKTDSNTMPPFQAPNNLVAQSNADSYFAGWSISLQNAGDYNIYINYWQVSASPLN